MRDQILHYDEIVTREKTRPQKGMSFRINRHHSIVLMSLRENSPYEDTFDEETGMLIYEGHDASRIYHDEPKSIDQPMMLPTGKLTENGKFLRAVLDYKDDKAKPEIVQVYEKIKKGIWSDKGFFHLVDSKIVHDGKRNIFKFYLKPIEIHAFNRVEELPQTRLIPSSVKVEVWKRDKGCCVICGKATNLHFDHDVPFSLGGSSLTAKNIRLLCLSCNLKKSDKIVSLLPWLIPMSATAIELIKQTKH